MNIFDNILDNYLYLYYTETYPRYDSLHGCSISFETQVCQGWEWIFCQRDSWDPFTSKDCLDWMFTSCIMSQNLVNEAINPNLFNCLVAFRNLLWKELFIYTINTQ